MTSRRSLLGMLGAGTALLAMPDVARASAKDFRPYERVLSDLAAQDKFAGTVLLTHRGKPVFTRSYGMANRERGIPNSTDTVFGLASVSKIFTAVAIGQLAQQGRLGFHEPLGAYLDGFPAGVTLHHLLTHTSGVGRPALGGGAPPAWQSFDQAMAETLAIIRQTPPQFTPPGIEHRYSNDGFWVLAAVVAHVSGQSYFDYVRERIFRPAGMTRTDFYSKPQVQADLSIARPYWTQRDGSRADFTASPFCPFTNGPAGGVYSTIQDLAAFASSSGTVLNGAFMDIITSGKVPLAPSALPSQAQFYGYGHIDAVTGDQRVHGHSGSGPGMATRFDVFPDLGWASIVLGNYDTNIDPIVAAARAVVTG
ncbi:MAG: serine hydrolase domain-containing protein [Kibdelosporangium sp.]